MGNCCGSSATVPSSPPPHPALYQPTVQSTHPISIPSSTEPYYPGYPSSTGPYPGSSVASTFQSSSRRPAHYTSEHDNEITPTPVAETPARVQSQVSAFSQGCRDDGDYPPPSSGGGMLASLRPHRSEMPSRHYSSGGRGAPRLNKSFSMDTSSILQGARSHSPYQMTRSSSAFLLGDGRPPAGTQSGSWPAPEISQVSAERHRPRFHSTLQILLPNDFRFRILVVGKRVSGKSSLLNTIFKVVMSGAPTDVSGITAEFRPRDNRHLIAHECSAFGTGDLQAIRDSIKIRNHKSRPASERIHAIWICVPMSDAINGQFDETVKILLDIGVPLVFVLTKFDLIAPNVSSNTAGGKDYERARDTAYTTYEEHYRPLFGNVPAEIVSTRPMFGDLIEKLVTTTNEVIIAHSRNISASSEAQRTQPQVSPVALAWSVSQRTSRNINIQATIEVGRNRYWRDLWNSDDFAGQTLANCVEVIHADIVGVWNLPDEDRYLSSTAFKAAMSYLLLDLSMPSISTSPKSQLSGTLGMGAAWLNNLYENSNENICLVVGYIVDLTLILCGVFISPGSVTPSQVQSVMNDFAGSLKTSIHDEICRFIRAVPGFGHRDNDVVVEKIIDLIRQNCDLPSGNAHISDSLAANRTLKLKYKASDQTRSSQRRDSVPIKRSREGQESGSEEEKDATDIGGGGTQLAPYKRLRFTHT